MQGVYTPLLCKNALTRVTAKNTSFKKHNDLVRSNIVQFGLEEDIEFDDNELPDSLISGVMPITGLCQESKQDIENHLSLISRKLATSLKSRKHDLTILEHAKDAFPFEE